jgi:antitoxin component YwqK of YwqJK toxin-antitoxin module
MNSDTWSVVISHIHKPKSFRSLFLTCKLLAGMCRLQSPQKRKEFLIPKTEKDTYITSYYTELPNGQREGWHHEIIDDGDDTETIESHYYVQDKRHGEYRLWTHCVDDNDDDFYFMSEHGKYVDDKKEGTFEEWGWDKASNSRQRRSLITYTNDKCHGPTLAWINKTLVKEHFYNHGKLHGIYREWYTNGVIKYIGMFVHGKPHGTIELYDSQGHITLKSEFQHGVRHGATETWDDQGRFESKKIYQQGEILKGEKGLPTAKRTTRCRAILKGGRKQCSRNTKEGKLFCFQHCEEDE